MRTTTAIRFDARINPGGAATRYYFEYGTAGACASNPCAASESRAAGDGEHIALVSQWVSGLNPGTIYHYRVVADDGAGGERVFGPSRTGSTLSNDMSRHGGVPGPPASDRVWEQVNAPDTGGNPVGEAQSIAGDGSRVIYRVGGATPDSESGSALNFVLAERTATGWHDRRLFPSRATEPSQWIPPIASDDLTLVTSLAVAPAGATYRIWRMPLDGAAQRLGEFQELTFERLLLVSDDGSRVLIVLPGSIDPAHPVADGHHNVYDLSSGLPRMVGLLPGGSPPACGVGVGVDGFESLGLSRAPPRELHWLSPDGSVLIFPSQGDGSACSSASMKLYVRDLEAGRTIEIPQALGISCDQRFVRATDGAVFFWTASQMVAEDTAVSSCSEGPDGDVYRYDIGDEALRCVTCVAADIDADVPLGGDLGSADSIRVAADGSRIYFLSSSALVPGAPAGQNAYRVDAASGELKLIARLSPDIGLRGAALTPDGSTLVFRSNTPWLNGRGGSDNGGMPQYYRYGDANGSLICLSCPQDGSAPAGPVAGRPKLLAQTEQVGPNLTPLTKDGDVVFTTPTALVPGDGNTADNSEEGAVGTDVYEWRDGRLLLISDGETVWANQQSVPEVQGVTGDGRHVFFTAPAALTPDALDSFRRLYDAKIAGGFHPPGEAPPCSGESCPRPAPTTPDPLPGSSTFNGRGNLQPAKRCRRGTRKQRRHGRVRCAKKPRGLHRSRRDERH